MRMRYVLGFCFENDLSSVVLIEKQKPDWQKGKLNGIGGKIEPDETELHAMCREFYEEAGVAMPERDWVQFCEMSGPNWVVFCFMCRNSSAVITCHTTTEEKIFWVDSKTLDRKPHVENLEWLIPLAMACARNKIESSVYFK